MPKCSPGTTELDRAENEGLAPRRDLNRFDFDIWSMAGLGKTLIILGIVLVFAGVLVSLSDRLPWVGHLPGDIHIERERFSFHFPLTTCIIISIVISLVAYLLKR